MVQCEITKEPPVVRAALAFTRVLFFHSHFRHPNHKQVLNNKDRKKDDKKGEREDRIHGGVKISPDYRQNKKSVKGQSSIFIFPLTQFISMHRIPPNMNSALFTMNMTTTSGSRREVFVHGSK